MQSTFGSPLIVLGALTILWSTTGLIGHETGASEGEASASAAVSRSGRSADEIHAQVFADTLYPSASECRSCHAEHYREWSVSQHAYAQISPVFNAMSGALLLNTSGTFGDFCIRCHSPVGMALGEPIFAPNSARAPVSLEGVTCVVCHRINKAFGKVSGRLAIEKGNLFAPVYGPRDNAELERVKSDPEEFGRVVTEIGELGRRIHREAEFFAPISSSGFCGTCHDVTFVNGFRLEEAFSEYKQSPAARRGETCQDCHMGTEPGIAQGYATAPAARIGGTQTAPKKRTNHMWVGPDHSVVNPGIFPHSPDAKQLATPEEWSRFDWRAGWGTDEFEDGVTDDAQFSQRWSWIDDRYDAREILKSQLKLLAEAREQGSRLLRRGYALGDVKVIRADDGGLQFNVQVRNGSDGHNAPTGFVAERLVFLRVTVTDSLGKVVFRSGDLDPNGDVRDLHSKYVHDGKLPLDDQLFSLQSRFLTRNVRGGEREQVLAINYSLDPLPFNRPATKSNILTGKPDGARTHRMGIEPGGSRTARYRVESGALTGSAPYSASIELVAGMVPVNLIDAISVAGFDYGLSARDIAEEVVAGHRILWKRDIQLVVD